jgi:hypothetical protein
MAIVCTFYHQPTRLTTRFPPTCHTLATPNVIKRADHPLLKIISAKIFCPNTETTEHNEINHYTKKVF